MSLDQKTYKTYCPYCCRDKCICFAAPQVIRELLGAAHKVLSQVLIVGPLKAAVPDSLPSHYMVGEALFSKVDDNPRMETPPPSARLEVRLETADGSLVTQTGIPPFQAAPRVIIWGDRVFGITGIGCAPYIYQEVFSYVLP